MIKCVFGAMLLDWTQKFKKVSRKIIKKRLSIKM